MKKIILLMIIIISGVACALEQQDCITENGTQEIVIQNGSTVLQDNMILENEPVNGAVKDQIQTKTEEAAFIITSLLKEPLNKKKRFDALDLFVKSWTSETSQLNAIEQVVSAVYCAITLDNTMRIFGFKKNAYLLIAVMASIGITDLACLLVYHSYRFVRGGIEAVAPAKTVKSINERLRFYYEYNWVTCKLAGIIGAMSFYVFYGSIEKKLVSQLIKAIL